MGHPFPPFFDSKISSTHVFGRNYDSNFLDMMYFFHLICTLGWIAVKQFNFWTPKIQTGHKFWTSMILKLRTPPFFQQTCCPKLENLYRNGDQNLRIQHKISCDVYWNVIFRFLIPLSMGIETDMTVIPRIVTEILT